MSMLLRALSYNSILFGYMLLLDLCGYDYNSYEDSRMVSYRMYYKALVLVSDIVLNLMTDSVNITYSYKNIT